MGLAGFLSHGDSGGGGKAGWLRKWTDQKKDTDVDVWLSTKADFFPVWKVLFINEDTVEEDGKVKKILRFPKFVSPEPEAVLKSQFFRRERKDMGTQLEMPPTEDPFLILREWLLLNSRLPDDAVVFKWIDRSDPDAPRTIAWRCGDLSLSVDKDKRNWRASISPKLSYLLTVVEHGKLGDGLVLTEENKLLCDKLKKTIQKEIESLGHDAGNPLITPYAFRWKSKPSERKVDEKYDVMRFSRAELTDEIFEIINSEPPDASQYATPRDGDLDKIRAYMEAAAQVEIPFDALFSEDPNERARLALENGGRHGPPAGRPAAQTRTSAPAQGQGRTQKEKAAEPEPEPAQAGTGRRRVKKEPPPPQTIPCDECGAPMLPTDTVCKKCGAEYEVDPAAQAPSTQTQKREESAGIPKERSAEDPKPKPTGGGTECFLCKSNQVKDGVCQGCGSYQDDDIPF